MPTAELDLAAPEVATLRELRDQSKLTILDVIEAARKIDDRFPRSRVGLLEIEARGTRDYWKIHALATAYGVSPDYMARLTKPRKSG